MDRDLVKWKKKKSALLYLDSSKPTILGQPHKATVIWGVSLLMKNFIINIILTRLLV
jgi:hypothetical protein